MKDDQIKQIQDLCWQRLNIIEESSTFGNIPQHAFDLYSLYYFIMTRSFQKYFQNFGPQTISPDNVAQAKAEYNFPKISAFEVDVIALLNQMVEGKRRKEGYNGPTTDNQSAANSVRNVDGAYLQGRGQPPAVIEVKRATG
jgi:hypothetical protein